MIEAMRKKILVVDDETKITRLLTCFLQSAGYEVHAEASGQAALDAVNQDVPDLVVLDLRLPDISGYEVSTRLRRNFNPSALPIVMITAMDRPEDRERGFEHGANAYMAKPFELDELNQTITTLLQEEPPTASAAVAP